MMKLIKEFWRNEDGFLPILGIALAVAGTIGQGASTVIQNKAAKRAEGAQRGAQELQAARERLQALREARIRRAEVASAAEAAGASNSSGAQGAQASIGTQLASNLGFSASRQSLAAEGSRANLAFNRAQALGSLSSQAVGLGSSVGNLSQRRAQNQANQFAGGATPVAPPTTIIGGGS